MRNPGVDGSQLRWRPGQAQPDQHGDHAQNARQRRGHGGDQHDQGNLPQTVLLQFRRSTDQSGQSLLTGGADGHDRERRAEPEQDQSAEIEGERQQQRITACVPQDRFAAEADRANTAGQRRQDLHLTAIGAFIQPRGGHDGRRGQRGGGRVRHAASVPGGRNRGDRLPTPKQGLPPMCIPVT